MTFQGHEVEIDDAVPVLLEEERTGYTGDVWLDTTYLPDVCIEIHHTDPDQQVTITLPVRQVNIQYAKKE